MANTRLRRQLANGTLAAIVAAAATAAITPARSDDGKTKEKCYGISKAGENACAAANGSHSCAGESKVNFSGRDWTLVESGSCAKTGGKSQAFDNPVAPAKPGAQAGG
jgi:uncharacterized membrane protein